MPTTRTKAYARVSISAGWHISYTSLISRIAELVRDSHDIPCLRRSSDPEWWHIEEKRFEDRAKALCMVCPVQRECLRHAMSSDETGVWGGMTRNERHRVANMRLVR